MKRPLSSRFIAAAVLAAAALGAATAAGAHTDVQVSIGLPGLPVYVQSPVYVRSEPVFGRPRPIYAPPPVEYGRPWRPSYRHDFERQRDWRRDEWHRREWQRREWERRHDDGHRWHGRGRD
jgi:hypothetical protein